VFIAASAPSALPLDAEVAVARSAAKLNSQPTGMSEASPGYVPLYGALPLLGGVGALPAIGARIVPGLIVGLPTVLGLPPIPVDPTVIPAPPVPNLPSPDLPPIECFATAPGSDPPTTCGGPSQDLLGFRMGAGSGSVSGAGSSDDISTLKVEASVRGAGFSPTTASALLPLSIGGIASAASSFVKDGRITAGASNAITDLSIGGTVKIPSLKTSISVALDGTAANASVQSERCTVSGATIAGVPVSIDGDGVHLVKSSTALGPVRDQLNATIQGALAKLGLTLKAVSGTADPGTGSTTTFPGSLTLAADGTKLSATLSCLQVTYKVPTSGTVVAVTFGTANIEAQAFTAESTTSSGGGPTPTTPFSSSSSGTSSGTGGTPSFSSSGGSDASGSGGSSGSLGAVPPPPAPTPGGTAPAPSATTFVRAGFGWSIPYPPFAILALAFPAIIWGRRSQPLRSILRH